MIESGRSVNPYTHSGSTLLRLGDGRIEKDESGCLGRGRQKVLGGVELELLDDRQRYDRWWTTQGQHSRSQKTVLAATPSHEPPSRRSAGCQFKRTAEQLSADFLEKIANVEADAAKHLEMGQVDGEVPQGACSTESQNLLVGCHSPSPVWTSASKASRPTGAKTVSASGPYKARP